AYAATCPGTSSACTCLTFSGTASGGLGKGAVTGALTLDNSETTPEEGCTPFFGSIAITNDRDATGNTIDVTGALCNSTPAGGTQPVGGGFDFDPATDTTVGTGSLIGTIKNTGEAKLRLIGVIAPAASPTPTGAPSGSPTASEVATPTEVPT